MKIELVELTEFEAVYVDGKLVCQAHPSLSVEDVLRALPGAEFKNFYFRMKEESNVEEHLMSEGELPDTTNELWAIARG